MTTLVSGNKNHSMLNLRVFHIVLTLLKPNMANKMLENATLLRERELN